MIWVFESGCVEASYSHAYELAGFRRNFVFLTRANNDVTERTMTYK